MPPLSPAHARPSPSPAAPDAASGPALVLASGSRYRAEAVARLGLVAEPVAPDVDETPAPGEPSRDLVLRLGETKARAVAARRPGRIVIGSDQSATLDAGTARELRLDKPGTPERARAQLAALSGRTLVVHTSLVVLDARPAAGTGVRRPAVQRHVDATRLRVRRLDGPEIRRYVAADAPLDCAGAFRIESLGPALFDAVESEDPSALVGLPLIALARALRAAGLVVP